MWNKRLLAYNRGIVMNAEAEGAGGGDGGGAAAGAGTILGATADAAVIFPDDKAADDGETGESAADPAADWKEYENDPAKSAEENATAKAAHDATKPKDDKDDPANKVPDDGKYDLKMPDGVDLDEELAAALGPDFKELGLTNAQAQKLVDKYISTQQARAEAHANSPAGMLAMSMQEYFKDAGTPDKWMGAAKADKEIGGANWAKTEADALRFVKHINDPELGKYLNASGGGNHPRLIAAFAKAGALIREDNPASGGAGGEGKPAEASYVMFPTDKPKG